MGATSVIGCSQGDSPWQYRRVPLPSTLALAGVRHSWENELFLNVPAPALVHLRNFDLPWLVNGLARRGVLGLWNLASLNHDFCDA